jgi:hypothetical protein
MAEPESKVCPLCAETIKATAKICPHCQSKLAHGARWRQELTGFVAAILVLAGFVAAIAWSVPDDSAAGRSFAGHSGDLQVINLTLKPRKTAPIVDVSGVVTNRGDYPWRVRELELRFAGPSGNLVEVQHPQVLEPFVVQPGQAAPFFIPLYRVPAEAINAKVDSRVQWATDGNRAVDPD